MESGKIDLVYILGSGSKWRNNELRYSLRSVEKHLRCAGKVFVVGLLPRWVNAQEAAHIKAEDPWTNKLKNAIGKIRLACKDPRVGERFILMNDDFFFLKDAESIGVFHMGRIATAIRNHKTKGGYYYRALRDTERMLASLGIERPVNYEVHYPMVIDKEKFLETTGRFNYAERAYLFRSVYGNLQNLGGVRRRDVKVFDFGRCGRRKQGDFLSTDNRAVLTNQFQRWISARFPVRSRYELEPRPAYYATCTMVVGSTVYNPGDIVPGPLPESVVKGNKMRKALQ